MKWTVVWVKEAEERLAQIWLNSTDRSGVSAATNQIELLLRSNPAVCGIVYDKELRLLICPPVAVIFIMMEQDRIVRILGVQSFR